MHRHIVTAGLCFFLSVPFAVAEGETKEKKPGAKSLPGVVFSRLDANGDGSLSKEELPERLRDRMSRIDGNSDGKVSQDELERFRDRMESMRKKKGETKPSASPAVEKSAAKTKPTPTTDKPMPEKGKPAPTTAKTNKPLKVPKKPGKVDTAALMQRADKNGDGKVSRDELPPPARERFATLDKNGDGSLDKEEFQRVVAVLREMRERMEERAAEIASSGAPRQQFYAQDLDADGRLTRSEAKGEIATKFDQLDIDKSGKLDVFEVMNGMANAEKASTPDKKK